MRNPQGGIADFAGLFAENGAQQPLLSGQLGLPLRGDLTHQDIAGTDLGADVDDAALVEILERVLADVRDIAGDLLRPELGIPGLDLIFLDVDGGEDVVPHDLFVDEHGVLVVIAFPGHEPDQDVLAQGDFTLVGGGAVGDDLARLHMLAVSHHRALVDAGPLVGPHEFD